MTKLVVMTADYQFNDRVRHYSELYRAGVTYPAVHDAIAAIIVASGAGYVPAARVLEEGAGEQAETQP